MLALSRLLSVGILLFLVAFFVWVFALMKTSQRADRMSQRWLERKWLDEERRANFAPDWNRLSELGLDLDEAGRRGVLEAHDRLYDYDQDETERS
jgi:hypothetical protein